MELENVRDEFDRVAKKQKLSYSKSMETVDTLIMEIKKSLITIKWAAPWENNPFNRKCVVSDLKRKSKEVVTSVSRREVTQRELHSALINYPKALDKTLNPDISKAYRHKNKNKVEFDLNAVHRIIADFLYEQGMFDIGDCFISETGEADSPVRKSFVEMHLILEAMKRRDLEPALIWADSNSDKLKKAKSDLEMTLHSIRFLEIAHDKTSQEAVNYIRKHIATFSGIYFPMLMKLMGSLLWNKNLNESPYAELLSPALWTKAAKELTVQYRNLVSESHESPLVITVAAASQALPPILKYMNLMVSSKKQKWQRMEQLPVPVELSEEFVFHSVFMCPVSKEQSSEDNPAMRLCCGHVLCKQSINRMSKNGSKSFKCPYCPAEIDGSQCKRLYF